MKALGRSEKHSILNRILRTREGVKGLKVLERLVKRVISSDDIAAVKAAKCRYLNKKKVRVFAFTGHKF